MRFVFAIISVVLAAVLIGVGVAQQTVLKLPDRVTASVHLTSDAPLTIIDGSVLRTYPNTQHLVVSGAADQTVFAAFGRTDDVVAWAGDAAYNVISFDPATRELVSTLHDGSTTDVPNPAGSDLWLGEVSGTGSVSELQVISADKSFILASDGSSAAPADVSISWPIDNSTPWAAPLLIAGGVLLILGLGLLLWAILHVRSARGPRRKSPKMPKLPKRPRYKPSKRTKQLPSGRRGRRSTRLTLVAVPVAALAVLSGCTALPDPILPTATATETLAPGTTVLPPPVVTETQAATILGRVRDVAAQADKDLDATLAATRFSGAALALRSANYIIRKDDSSQPAVTAIPDDKPLVLPQANDGWPRTVFLVAGFTADAKQPPLAMMLTQQDPRSEYKVEYAVSLEPGTQLPDVAKADVGAPQQDPDTPLLTIVPSQLAAAYGDILMTDSASEFYPLFDESTDSLRTSVGLDAKKKRQKALPSTAKLTFANTPGTAPVIVLSTIDSGAIVAVELDESETVKPVQTGATVSAPKDVRALSGTSSSTKGLQAVYGDQLLFYVPSQTAGGQAKLLGYASGMVSASEVKK